MRSADTTPEVHRLQIEAFRRMSPARRVELAVELSEAVMENCAAGIRRHHPDYDEDKVRWALLRLRLGDEVFRRVWPHAPLVTP